MPNTDRRNVQQEADYWRYVLLNPCPETQSCRTGNLSKEGWNDASFINQQSKGTQTTNTTNKHGYFYSGEPTKNRH